MLTQLRIKNNFYSDLFEKEKVADIYQCLQLGEDHTIIYESKTPSALWSKMNVQTLVPDYLNTSLFPQLTAHKIFQKKGHAVSMKSITNIDNYLKQNAGSNFKKNTLRTLRRLEQCFDITYKMFYGSIDTSTYNKLMDALINMIEKRFQERKGRNLVIENWDYYKAISLNLINKKSASLFVIYSNNQPIEISLNFHQDSIMYSAISSYDLNYYKFSLGNIEIYRQLQWCLKNNISIFDMGYGDFDYKIKWSNLSYNFNTHIISNNNNLMTNFYSYYLKNKYRFINYLIEKEVTNSLRGFIAFFKGKSSSKDPYENYTIEKINNSTNTNISEIDITQDQFSFLQKPLNEFLYANAEYIKNVKVYKANSDENTFVFIGPTTTSKLHFKNIK